MHHANNTSHVDIRGRLDVITLHIKVVCYICELLYHCVHITELIIRGLLNSYPLKLFTESE